MSKQPTSNRNGRWSDLVLIVAFAGLLGLPMLDSWLHLDHAPVTGENRLPAAAPVRPDGSLASYRRFCAAFEAYYDDHFGFRNRLIRWYQNWRIGLYHDRSVYRVMTGRDGWLFWAQQQMVENYLGLNPFTPEDLQAWQSLLEHRRDWLARRGIAYVFVIAPDKQDIYPEHLPDWLARAAAARNRTKVDQFVEQIRAHSTVTVVDLRGPLLAAKNSWPLYLKNDTHWNQYGALIAYQDVLGTLQRAVPGNWSPKRPGDFVITNCSTTVPGDLGAMIGTEQPEPNYFQVIPRTEVGRPTTMELTNWVARWDAHKNYWQIRNPEAPERTAVFFHDSFGEYWRPFLARQFSQITGVGDNREFATEVITNTHPDIVISEILERYFDTVDPQAMLRAEHWK